MIIPDELVRDIIMLPCCRFDIGNDKSLSIGLGKRCQRKSRLSKVEYYGEWEFGTYNAMWRIIQSGQIVIGSCDLNNGESNLKLPFQEKLTKIIPLSEFDIRLHFTDNFMIDFFNCANIDDEVLHILHIDGNFWELNNKGGWTFGHSPLPMSPQDT
jgi:hypothetical protein